MLSPFPDFGWSFSALDSNSPINWTNMLEEFEWLRGLRNYLQDQTYLEKDLLAHTKLACEILVTLPIWNELTKQTQSILFLAVILENVAKTVFNTYINEQNSLYKHTKNSSKIVRQILWEMKIPFFIREMIVALISEFSLPFYLFERIDPKFSIIKASQIMRLDWLSILFQVDALTRNYQEQKGLLERLELFIEFIKEEKCFDSARKFPSDHSRFIYFQKTGDPNYHAYDDTSFEVILMCGLPASGKDTWIKENLALPVISLDDIRKELKIAPNKNQGEIIRESKERARVFLRNKKNFVWNATNTICSRRSQLIDLFSNYQARTRIVYLETFLDELFKRNQKRDETVPRQVIKKMIYGLEIPNLTEAHKVDWIIT
ncbi:MAG: AAA family ATPase [Acidobacteria bacterium]|nr:AAA family ATPase [Acidobacteriota bacterium]